MAGSLQEFSEGAGGFFGTAGRFLSEAFRHWATSTNDAASIVTWFVFAVGLVIGLGLGRWIVSGAISLFDRDRSRAATRFLEKPIPMLAASLFVAFLFAGTAGETARESLKSGFRWQTIPRAAVATVEMEAWLIYSGVAVVTNLVTGERSQAAAQNPIVRLTPVKP